jgi:hypothetical protein
VEIERDREGLQDEKGGRVERRGGRQRKRGQQWRVLSMKQKGECTENNRGSCP